MELSRISYYKRHLVSLANYSESAEYAERCESILSVFEASLDAYEEATDNYVALSMGISDEADEYYSAGYSSAWKKHLELAEKALDLYKKL